MFGSFCSLPVSSQPYLNFCFLNKAAKIFDAVVCKISSREEVKMPEVLLGFWVIISVVAVSPWEHPLKCPNGLLNIWNVRLKCFSPLCLHWWIFTHYPLSPSLVRLHLLMYFKACPGFYCFWLTRHKHTHSQTTLSFTPGGGVWFSRGCQSSGSKTRSSQSARKI